MIFPVKNMGFLTVWLDMEWPSIGSLLELPPVNIPSSVHTSATWTFEIMSHYKKQASF